MELPYTPGTVAFFINIITDVLGIIALFSLVKTLNAYGRWKLYLNGKVSMDMHFHDMSFVGALVSVCIHRRAQRAVFFLLFIQMLVCLAVLALKTVAPIGISESTNRSIRRHHTVSGASVCRGIGTGTSSNEMLGIATERIITHFEAGGEILSVGRTGKNHDALIMEDENGSLGRTTTLHEWGLEARITLVEGEEGEGWGVSFDYSVFFRDALEPDDLEGGGFSISTVESFPGEPPIAVVEGPLYLMVLRHKVFQYSLPPALHAEKYMFAKCALERTQLEKNGTVDVTVDCTVANFERNTVKNGVVVTIPFNPFPLKILDQSSSGLNLSSLGQRSVMAFDLANALSQKQCGDTYEAYLQMSDVSITSLIIIAALAFVALVCLVAAIVSFKMTHGTFNWNGSYQRVINLAANSESIGVATSSRSVHIVDKADVVVEACQEGDGYRIHIVSRDTVSYPESKASPHLIR